MVEGWAKIKRAAAYAGVSERTFREWLKQGLKHIQLKTATILIFYKNIDEFLKLFQIKKSEVDQIVDQVFNEIQHKN